MTLRVERREETTPLQMIFAYAAAIGLGFLVTAGLIWTSGADPVEGFTALFEGAFGDREALLGSLVKATPLICTGLATAVAFRAQVWNIGQEGQLFAGAMAAYWASLFVPTASPFVAVPVILLAGLTGGALLGGLAGVLKTRFGVSEIISTVMLNYTIVYVLSYLLAGGPWMETGVTTAYHQSPPLPDNVRLPILVAGSKLHLGFALAIVLAAALHVLLERTPLGYEIRALGHNPTALRYQGVNTGRTVLIVMAVSGAAAALGGVGELFGVNIRLQGNYLTGLGYTGIIIGMIGGMRPVGTVIAGLFFGALESGALYMKILADVPSALVPAMEGVVLLFVLCASVMVRFRVTWGGRDG